nr:MAG TPA: hypothetical protein [Caudoviricetes sp.]
MTTRTNIVATQTGVLFLEPRLLANKILCYKGRKCDDTHQHCSNTNGCFVPRTPVASKQPTCVESEREVNKSKRKVNGNCERSVCRGGRHHTPSRTALQPFKTH